jgi:predicted secreted protein
MIYDDKQDVVDGLRRPGAPGKQEWLLQTNCVGHYRVIFVYKRPWEGGPPSNQTIIEFVTIKE